MVVVVVVLAALLVLAVKSNYNTPNFIMTRLLQRIPIEDKISDLNS